MGNGGCLHKGPAVAYAADFASILNLPILFFFSRKKKKRNKKKKRHKSLHSISRLYRNIPNSTIQLGNQRSCVFYRICFSVVYPEWLPSSTFTHFALAITTHLKIPGPESLTYSFPLAEFSFGCPRIAGPSPASTACTRTKHCSCKGPTHIYFPSS